MQTARNMRNFYTFSDSPIKMQFTGYFYQKLSRSNFSYLLWHSVELIEECAFYYFPQNFLFTQIESWNLGCHSSWLIVYYLNIIPTWPYIFKSPHITVTSPPPHKINIHYISFNLLCFCIVTYINLGLVQLYITVYYNVYTKSRTVTIMK